jgi:hypothetical protein
LASALHNQGRNCYSLLDTCYSKFKIALFETEVIFRGGHDAEKS